jgi:hypothetical protein
MSSVMRARRWAVISGAVLIGSVVFSTGRADQNLNCDAYAASAVEQQQRNGSMACLLTGTGWSADFDAHRAWCLLPEVRMADLTREQNARESALQECIQRDITCGQYAIQAREHNQLNIGLGCGFSGELWSNDVNAHRAWCMKANPATVRAQTTTRSFRLQECRAKKAMRPAKTLEDNEKLPAVRE